MTKQIFANSFPWLFPGGIGDLYDRERGTVPIKEWAKHLLRYYDGRFQDDQMFCLYLFNTIQRYTNNTQGHFFVAGKKFLGENPPTVEQIKKQIQKGDDRFVSMLRYFSRNIKGSDNYWRAKTQDLESWIMHHVTRGRGPPTFFITFSCAEHWWPDLRRLLWQLEEIAGNKMEATQIKSNDFTAIQRAAKKYPLYVNELFMKRANAFMKTVVQQALGIEYYWGRIEFAPGRGQIHLHLVGIADDKAYLTEFHKAKTMEEKARVVESYAKERLDMTADVRINDSKDYRKDIATSPLATRYCEATNECEDARILAQDCMVHHCNKYCLRETTKSGPRECRVTGSTESLFGKSDAPGYPPLQETTIQKSSKGFHRFCMKRTQSVRITQHSRYLLQGWRGNCDIQLLLYFSDPLYPDIGEIDEVCKYVVGYATKKHKGSKHENSTIQNLILRLVQVAQKYQTSCIIFLITPNWSLGFHS